MSQRLALQRCWNHPARDAGGRCVECSRDFCLECIVDHAGLMICSGCLARIQTAAAKPKRRLGFAPVLRLGAAIAGIVLAWIIFFSAGRMLLGFSDKFHGDTLWKRTLIDEFLDEASP